MDKERLIAVDYGIPDALKVDSATVSVNSADREAQKTEARNRVSRNGYSINWVRNGRTEVGYCRKK